MNRIASSKEKKCLVGSTIQQLKFLAIYLSSMILLGVQICHLWDCTEDVTRKHQKGFGSLVLYHVTCKALQIKRK